jgi:hypothetical protein
MLHTSGHFRRIHRRFIARCYRRGCPAVSVFPLHSESYQPTAVGFVLGHPRGCVEVLLNRTATDAQGEERGERRAGVLGNWEAQGMEG